MNRIPGTIGSAAKAFAVVLAFALLASASAKPAGAKPAVGAMVNDVCRTSTDAAFRAKYCQAAKDNKKGYVANKATSTIWGGVAVVCLAACGKAANAAGAVCKYSSIGGGVADGAITKKFVDSITGGASAFKPKEEGAVASRTSIPHSQGGTRFDGEACTTAAETAQKSFAKKSDAKKNVEGLSQLRDQTVGMNTLPKDKVPAFEIAAAGKRSASTGGSDPCDESVLGSAIRSIRCAAKVDPTLPAYVKSANFLRDLERASGKSADEFFSGFDSPASELLDAAARNGISAEGQAGAAEALLAMQKRSERSVSALARESDGYRQGSGKPDAKEDETGFDVNGAIANVLGQMEGEAAKEEPTSGVESITVGDRAPAGQKIEAEDRTISLFDRVKWRYGAVSTRQNLGILVPNGGKQ